MPTLKDIAKYEGLYDCGYEAVRKARYERQLASGLFDEEVTPLSEAEHKIWSELSPRERKEEALADADSCRDGEPNGPKYRSLGRQVA